MGTGHHAAVVANVAPGHRVAVVGDEAVGLCGVIAAKRLGAEQILIMGRPARRSCSPTSTRTRSTPQPTTSASSAMRPTKTRLPRFSRERSRRTAVSTWPSTTPGS